MNATDVIGYAYHADTYCAEHGEALPDIDPEGNDKTVVFCGHEADRILRCATCGEVLEGMTLTDYGVRAELDELLAADVTDRWARDAAADLLTVAAESLRGLELAYVQALADDDHHEVISGTRRVLQLAREYVGELPRFSDGGYPMFYVDRSNEVICSDCANDSFNGDPIVGYDINWESEMYCDSCGNRIPSAYSDNNEREAE